MKKEKYELRQMQAQPLNIKILMTQRRIRDWYEYWNGDVYVSFSGGKDSTVLLHITRQLYPDIKAVFVDTGLEYPEIKEFVKSIDNVIWLRPKMSFKEVIEKYGYPVISKEQAKWIENYRIGKTEKMKLEINKVSKKWQYLKDAPFKISAKCCDKLKKDPVKRFEKEFGLKPILGNMACESRRRTQEYLKVGCNAFEAKRPISRPLSFWLEEDIWNYIKTYNVPYSKIYDMGYDRTGCMFCMFGVHLEKEPNKFQRMKITHPQLYDYCLNKLDLKQVLDYIHIKYE